MAKCKRFDGKVALITAATAGIGLGIAHRLGEEGAKLVICSRRQAGPLCLLGTSAELLSLVQVVTTCSQWLRCALSGTLVFKPFVQQVSAVCVRGINVSCLSKLLVAIMKRS